MAGLRGSLLTSHTVGGSIDIPTVDRPIVAIRWKQWRPKVFPIPDNGNNKYIDDKMGCQRLSDQAGTELVHERGVETPTRPWRRSRPPAASSSLTSDVPVCRLTASRPTCTRGAARVRRRPLMDDVFRSVADHARPCDGRRRQQPHDLSSSIEVARGQDGSDARRGGASCH
ncbi:MAG: hypothetical protein MI923_03215 [Phycisphaerales bacterium]|nr:hypothetical protein [Phycisphaerales bacterium]